MSLYNLGGFPLRKLFVNYHPTKPLLFHAYARTMSIITVGSPPKITEGGSQLGLLGTLQPTRKEMLRLSTIDES